LKKEIISLRDSLKKAKYKSPFEINKIRNELATKKRLYRTLSKPKAKVKPKPQPKPVDHSDEEEPVKFTPKPKPLPIPKQGKPISKNKYKKLLSEAEETGIPIEELVKEAQNEFQPPPPQKDRSKDVWTKRQKLRNAANQAVFNPGYKIRLSKFKSIRK
jgi:hypothetical protein